MSQKDDEFDFLTFYIIVMVVLTLIVGLFAWLLYGRAEKESRNISSELRRLRDMQELAQDEKFRTWVQRERDGKVTQGPASEFNARIVKSAQRARVTIDRLDPKPLIERRGFQELPFQITVKNTQLEPLAKFLFDVEEKWIGAKVKEMSLNFSEKENKWSAEIQISIFKTNAGTS